MPSIIDQLTEIYVFIDDHLKQHPEKAQWRGSNNSEASARRFAEASPSLQVVGAVAHYDLEFVGFEREPLSQVYDGRCH